MFQQQQQPTTNTGSFMQGAQNPNPNVGVPSASFQNPMMQNQNAQPLFPGQTNPINQQQNFQNPMQGQFNNPQMNQQFNPALTNTNLKALTANQNQENELQMVFNNFLNAIK